MIIFFLQNFDDLILLRREADNIVNLMGIEKKEPTKKKELIIRKFLFNRFKKLISNFEIQNFFSNCKIKFTINIDKIYFIYFICKT